MAYGSINVPGLDIFDLLEAGEKAIPESSDFLLGVEGEELIRVPADAVGGGGKRTCIVIGTSTAGWTEKDCDYLCDGTDDQVEIQAAINDLPDTGGNIVVLAGTYIFSGTVTINKNHLAIRGNGGNTVFQNNEVMSSGLFKVTISSEETADVHISSMAFNDQSNIVNKGIYAIVSAPLYKVKIRNCDFYNYTTPVSGAFSVQDCVFKKDSFITSSQSRAISNAKFAINCTISNYFFGCYGIRTIWNCIIDTCVQGVSVTNSNHEGLSIIFGCIIKNAQGENTSGNMSACGVEVSSTSKIILYGNILISCKIGVYMHGLNTVYASIGAICSFNRIHDCDVGIKLASVKSARISSNSIIRGTGLASDYTSAQYTIYLSGTANSNLLVSDNLIPGKNYTSEGGTGNTFVNNKYN